VYRLPTGSSRFGRKTVQGGLFAGLALVLLVLHLTAPRPDVWDLSSAKLMPSLTHTALDGDGGEPGRRAGGVDVRVRPAQGAGRGTSRGETGDGEECREPAAMVLAITPLWQRGFRPERSAGAPLVGKLAQNPRSHHQTAGTA
jgi:hypothetical protein